MTMLKRLCQNKLFWFSVGVLGCVLVMALTAPWIAPFPPLDINPEVRLTAPNGMHLFGTDNFGRDILSRTIAGASYTLITGLGVVVFAIVGGSWFGMLSAYFPKLGLVLMRIIDLLMSFPSLLLALVLISILDRSVLNAIIAVSVIYMATTARIVYGLTLKILTETFIEAARSLGASHLRVMVVHILPNLISPLIVQTTFIFAFSQLQMAALDFLGLGLPPQTPSWGNMINEAKLYISRAPWLIFFPGTMIVLTVFSLNMVGDFLRDRLDPKFQSEL